MGIPEIASIVYASKYLHVKEVAAPVHGTAWVAQPMWLARIAAPNFAGATPPQPFPALLRRGHMKFRELTMFVLGHHC